MKRKNRQKKRRRCKQRHTENTPAGSSATAMDDTEAVQASSDDDYADHVDPWTAISKTDRGFDYDDIIKRLKCEKVDNQLIRKIEELTKEPVHYLISRGIACSHRDMYKIINGIKRARERGQNDKFYLYTGRGPSSKAMHLGHAIPFILTKWLQDTFGVPLVIQITDDEKFLWRDIPIDRAIQMADDNIKDIIAFGFDPTKTFIFTDIKYMGREFYKNICRIEKMYNVKNVKDLFGFNDDDCIGKLTFPAIQAAPSFSSSFPDLFNGNEDVPCLIPCAIDQDSMFRMARDVAPKLGCKKPAVLHTKFLMSLKCKRGKMSASHPDGAIFLTDEGREIERKIRGCDRAVLFQLLSFFMEDNRRFKQREKEYELGTLTTTDLKAELETVLRSFTERFRRRRNNITAERMQRFMSP